MKKLTYLSIILLAMVTFVVSCSDVKRKPGNVYMPDMAYSRAYETYAMDSADIKRLRDQGINFSNTPVEGTVKWGEEVVFHMASDTTGMYVKSAEMKNPVAMPDSVQMADVQRLFNINCAICHGTKLDGNGPLWKDGAGPYPAAPKNLVSGDLLKMSEGTMFHSITYGKNKMGSYASQLNPKQRWMIVHYIKSKQAAVAPAEPATPAADSVKGKTTK
jgi:mono/diheme cytochrome c family protein